MMSQTIPPKSVLASPSLERPHFFTAIQIPRQGSKITTQENLQTDLQEKLENQILYLSDPVAQRAMIAIMDLAAVMGGAASHWGGPAAFAELVSAVHGFALQRALQESKAWHELFHIINDAGHCENGLYALKANYGYGGLKFQDLLGFRSIRSRLTGHGESHLFPECVELSNGPLGSALPQSQGLCLADRKLKNRKLTITLISDGACMEGEARESLAAIPGLAHRDLMNPFVLVISDNNTKLSGRIDQESFSMQPTFESLSSLGWKVFKLPDGNNLQSCYQIIDQACAAATTNPRQPVAVWAKTVKGFGVKKTAESSSGGHGFPVKNTKELKEFLSEIYSGKALPSELMALVQELETKEKQKETQKQNAQFQEAKKLENPFVWNLGPEDKIQKGVSAAMICLRKKGLPLVSITSDLPGSTGVAGFRKEFPDDSWDVGVAEANMISVAAGFSRAGFIPVVDTFAQFGVTKGSLPLTMAALSEAPMIGIFSHTGFQDAADGASHQALTYLSKVGSIPNTKVYALTNATEAESLVEQALEKFYELRRLGKTPPTTLFFLGRENFPIQLVPGFQYKLDQTQNLFEQVLSNTVTLIASGSLVVEAMTAARELGKAGIGAIVINPSCQNQFQMQPILSALNKSKGRFVIAEDHQVFGGLGMAILAEIMGHHGQLEHPPRFRHLGVRGEFGQSAYSSLELYSKHQMDGAAIYQAAKDLLINA